jgi:RNA polymerase sigma-70 factor (ECF subfamily)
MTEDWKPYWNGLIQGDRKAFKKLYQISVEVLFRYSKRVTQDEALIEDALQELFVRIWQKREQLPQDANPKAYLYTAIRNNLIRKLERHYNKFSDVEVEQTIDELSSSAEDKWMEAESLEELSDSLRKVIHALPDRQRELIHLKYTCGMSYEEIEEIMGVKYQSLRNLMSRALRSLRDGLDDIMLIFLLWLGTNL